VSTSEILGAAGAVVGGFFGFPQLGYAIGSAIGGAIDPQVIKGPSIGDIAKQTSMEGMPRPIVWALSPPMAGNIIASSEPKIVRKRKRQGKGGPKVETEHVYRTYAIGVCEGPITRFVRVWRNNTLVYDASEFPLLTQEENAEFLKHARFFLGTWDQNPSPALEKIFGVGTTPAHRGTAYMVMEDEELTDLRGAIPQYMFQVERCEGFFVTSRPYPIESEDAVSLSFDVLDPSVWTPPSDDIDLSFAVLGGSLVEPVASYVIGDDAVDISFSVIDGTLVTPLVAYTMENDALELDFAVIDGTLDTALITYTNPDDALDLGFAVLGGTLE